MRKRRLGSPRYQLGDARGRLNSVRESKPLQISPMILLLAQWFNTAQPFCSSHTKWFRWNRPTFFLWLNTSRQWSVDWQDCGFLPSASICYSHLPQSLTRELSLGSVQIACLERYKNQIIVSSTVKCSRIFCQPEPAGDRSRQRIFSHTFCILQRLSADMPLYLNICLFLSLFYQCPDCLRFGNAMKGVNHHVCLVNENTQWPYASFSPDPPCRRENLHSLVSNLKGLFAYRLYFPGCCMCWHRVSSEQVFYVIHLFAFTALVCWGF